MNTYNIPRDTSGEGKLLYIFSYKALAFTIVGAVIGYIFYLLLKTISVPLKLSILPKIGLVICGLLRFVGFAIATFKVPKINILPVTEYIYGEKIDSMILRYIKHKRKTHTKYVLFTKRDDYNNLPRNYVAKEKDHE